MRIFVAFLLLGVTSVAPEFWKARRIVPSLTNFFKDRSNKMWTFGENFNNFNMKDSDENYVDKQQEASGQNIYNYIDEIHENGINLAGPSSFNIGGDTYSLLNNPDMILAVPEIITRNGYVCETHTVISQGYVLNIHRIPHSKYVRNVPSKTVLLQHGLLMSSADWIINGPGKGLAYVLADAGYDVWLTNVRGNRYSKDHVWFELNSRDYWDFSWHDVAMHDIPKVIDYILTIKGTNTKITYIGHSMGTTILFAMLTLRPEYNNILTAGIALAPEVFLSNMKSPIKSVARVTRNLAYLDKLQGRYEFMPKNSALGKIPSRCSEEYMNSLICKNILFYVFGFNERQFNMTLLPDFVAHSGTGTSWKTVVHFSQGVLSGKFQQYDYGYLNNWRFYGAGSPPEYDLRKVTLPIKIFWSKNDLLSSEKDVRELYDRLPLKPEMFLVPDEKFSHLDYLGAIDAPILLNNEVLNSLHNYMYY